MPYLMCLCGMLLVLNPSGLTDSIAAEPSQERIALSLSGVDCSSQRPFIVAALAQIPGVNHVDLESVPDHALIDVGDPTVTSDALRSAANKSVASGIQCLIETMKSCISASPMALHR